MSLALVGGWMSAACTGSASSRTAVTVRESTDRKGGVGPQQGLHFEATTLDGSRLDSSEFAGRDLVLWFWAPWCVTCRAEAGDVVDAARAMKGKVEVVGVAGRGSVEETKAFVEDTDTGALRHVVDGEGTIWTRFGVFAQPAYAFIDDSGSVSVAVGALGKDASWKG